MWVSIPCYRHNLEQISPLAFIKVHTFFVLTRNRIRGRALLRPEIFNLIKPVIILVRSIDFRFLSHFINLIAGNRSTERNLRWLDYLNTLILHRWALKNVLVRLWVDNHGKIFAGSHMVSSYQFRALKLKPHPNQHLTKQITVT